MSNLAHIQAKLKQFTQKYYTNELIKGLILFFSFGILYLFFTIFVEHFLWLKPSARTLLFWLFIAVEATLLTKYIILPLAKLFNLRKQLSAEEASNIIGNYFPEVDDKLLNVLQLSKNQEKSELLLASIEQKSASLQPIPFKKAIDFSTNKKYLKYAVIPLLIWGFTFFTGNQKVLTQSFDRVVNYQTAYEPPAPFKFELLNDNLQTIEGKPFTVRVTTKGNIVPEDVHIHFNDQKYLLQNKDQGVFEYTFSSINKPIDFNVSANNVVSNNHTINVIRTPTINGLSMYLSYPKHTKKRNERIANTGNAVVPKGTVISWNVKANNATKVALKSEESMQLFASEDNKDYKLSKRLSKDFSYQINTSNNDLKDYEKLDFSIKVIQDEFPKINIKTNIDSISKGPAQFAGQLSDDYGLKGLQLVYYDKANANNKQILPLAIGNSTFEEFYYVFPEKINLQQGVDYAFYFEVFDNDNLPKNKATKSKTYNYYKKTDLEEKEQLLKEQSETLNSLSKSLEKSKEVQESFKKLEKNLHNKSEANWNDKQQLKNFIKKQEQYKQMMQRQTDELLQNLEEQPENKSLQERKEDILKRIEETKELSKQQEMLEELKKLADKLQKDDLLKKIDKFSQQSKQEERNLERLLELTKQFYVEQKAQQIKDKLDELAKKQEELAKSKENTAEKQEELNKEFEKLQEEMRELEKQNEELKNPMDLEDTKPEEKSIEEDMQDSKDKLNESEQSQDQQSKSSKQQQAKSKQKSASQKMKQMSQQMQQSMQQQQGEMMEENLEALRAILENLIDFSYRQEALMDVFSTTTDDHPEYAQNLKKQHTLKTYFEHIDDSLYTLSMRLPKMTSKIQKDLSDAHYNLNQSIENLTDDRYTEGVSNQMYVMTAANNLAHLLSQMQDAMQNPSGKPGQGGKGGKSFSLPDIIKQQSEMLKQCESGSSPGQGRNGKQGKDGKSGQSKGDGKSGKDGKNGQSKGNGNAGLSDGEVYEIYKQQAMMKQALQDVMEGLKGDKSAGNNAVKQMEELEKELLEKGVTKRALEKMSQIKHELLKLKEATHEQGEEEKRTSKTNKDRFDRRNIKDIFTKKDLFSQDEILNRQSLPLRTLYKKKVQEYFKE